jgi:hypothetical protein
MTGLSPANALHAQPSVPLARQQLRRVSLLRLTTVMLSTALASNGRLPVRETKDFITNRHLADCVLPDSGRETSDGEWIKFNP